MNLSKYNEELINLYHTFYQKSIDDIRTGKHAIDDSIDQVVDNRRGLSLIIRPDQEVQQNIKQFTRKLEQIDERQYYQPCSDMHITVLSIISCQEDFKIEQIDIQEYKDIIETSLIGIKDIAVHSKGVTTTGEAVMVQGFMENDNLINLRDRLRVNFRKSTLKQDIDTRYLTKTAHVTATRFRKKITNPTRFVDVIDDYINFNFGINRPKSIDLIYTDWFCRKSKVELLHRFNLR